MKLICEQIRQKALWVITAEAGLPMVARLTGKTRGAIERYVYRDPSIGSETALATSHPPEFKDVYLDMSAAEQRAYRSVLARPIMRSVLLEKVWNAFYLAALGRFRSFCEIAPL